MVVDRNIQVKAGHTNKGKNRKSNMYTGIEVKVENTLQALHKSKVEKPLISTAPR